MLFMSNPNPESPLPNDSYSSATSLPTNVVEPIEVQSINDGSEKKNYDDNNTTALMVYEMSDCSMPGPPPNVIDSWNENSWGEDETKPDEDVHHGAKVTFRIPIHTVHMLPNSVRKDLRR